MSDFIEGEDNEVEHDPFDPLDIERVEVTEKSLAEARGKKVIEFAQRRQQAYQRMFAGAATKEDVELVVADLTGFCFGDATVFHQDERIHCLLTGRQEVIRRIRDHTDLTLEAFLAKYTRSA
jgi:hypothetical protein